MQEEVENRTVNLAISTTKLTFRTIVNGYNAWKRHHQAKVAQKTAQLPIGKQSIKELIGQNQGVSSIPIEKTDLKGFEQVARKYGVDFKTVGEHELAETRTMDVLLVQPNAYPKKISVGTELEDLQAMVGGDIEVTYPFEDEVAIILNESGKINGLPLNRAIYTEDGDMQDIYAGDFLVVGLTEDDFGSLTSEQMQKFEEQFHQPQMFVRMGRSIMAIPVPDDMVKKMEEKAAKPQEKSKPAPDRDSL